VLAASRGASSNSPAVSLDANFLPPRALSSRAIAIREIGFGTWLCHLMLAATEMICIFLGVGRAFMYLACGADGPALPKVIHKTLNKPKTCSAVIILCSKLRYEIIIDKSCNNKLQSCHNEGFYILKIWLMGQF
jgi:hypothetical protein